MDEVSDYSWLVGDAAARWLELIAHDPRTELQQLESLRRDLTRERARLIVEQVALRKRAVDKFGDLAGGMLFTRQLLEQSTDIWIARYKASHFDENNRPTDDYCCGLGGDLIGLLENHETRAYDLSPIACFLAETNSRGRAEVYCKDVSTLMPERGRNWHLDPDRRAVGRRVTEIADYLPSPALIEEWRKRAPDGAVKLAPATVAPDWGEDDIEWEWISRDGECRQQVVWFGYLGAPGAYRSATVVRRDGTVRSIRGILKPCEAVDAPGDYLYDPDPSVLASGLLGCVAGAERLRSLGVGGSYLTGDRLVSDLLLARFRVLDCMPLRPAVLAKYLAERSVGAVEIKKRGAAIDPEQLRRRLKLRGDNAATLLLTRVGRRELAIIAERDE